jgi:hypothetical protein
MYVKTLGKITSLNKLGDVAVCLRAVCVLCVVHSETLCWRVNWVDFKMRGATIKNVEDNLIEIN